EAQLKLMQNGYKAKLRPSEHDISDKFGKDNKGAIPPNLIDGLQNGDTIGQPVLVAPATSSNGNGDSELVPVNVVSASNTSSNDQYLRLCRENGVKPHPARFPYALPEFIIGLCSEPNDVVLDPFAGSNMTGYAAETTKRKWISFEENEEYLRGSIFRFNAPNHEKNTQKSLFENDTDF
ncbi:MAG: site-specific DNA-methyltransferase, partial [Chloroflexota bacterium]